MVLPWVAPRSRWPARPPIVGRGCRFHNPAFRCPGDQSPLPGAEPFPAPAAPRIMEIRLEKRYALSVTADQAWAVLSDIRAVARCMPGARITGQASETRFEGTVRSRIGPATLTFNGVVELLHMDAANRQLDMVGKGSDRAGSSASMRLSARIEPDGDAKGTVLVGEATVDVGGKLAQFGSRLLMPVMDTMLASFADNFRSAAACVPATGTSREQARGSTTPDAVGDAVARPELDLLALWRVLMVRLLRRVLGRVN